MNPIQKVEARLEKLKQSYEFRSPKNKEIVAVFVPNHNNTKGTISLKLSHLTPETIAELAKWVRKQERRLAK